MALSLTGQVSEQQNEVYFLEHFSFSWDGVIQQIFFLVLSLTCLLQPILNHVYACD